MRNRKIYDASAEAALNGISVVPISPERALEIRRLRAETRLRKWIEERYGLRH